MKTTLFVALLVLTMGCQTKNSTPVESQKDSQTPSKTTVTNVKTWRAFTSEKYAFRVEFPFGDPTERPFVKAMPSGVGEIGVFSAEVWTVESKVREQWTVIAIPFTAKANFRTRLEVIDGVLATLPIVKDGNAKAEKTPITWAGQGAEETVYRSATEQTLILRTLLDDRMTYIAFVHDFGKLTELEKSRFFNSFQLLKK